MRRTAVVISAAALVFSIAAPASAGGGMIRGDEGQGEVAQVVGPLTVVAPTPAPGRG